MIKYEHYCYVPVESYEEDFQKAMAAAVLGKPFDQITREERARMKRAFFSALSHWKKIQKDYVQEALDRQHLEFLKECEEESVPESSV